MIAFSLSLILVAVALLAFGLTAGSSPLLIASIAASLLAAIALVIAARQAAAARRGTHAGRPAPRVARPEPAYEDVPAEAAAYAAGHTDTDTSLRADHPAGPFTPPAPEQATSAAAPAAGSAAWPATWLTDDETTHDGDPGHPQPGRPSTEYDAGLNAETRADIRGDDPALTAPDAQAGPSGAQAGRSSVEASDPAAARPGEAWDAPPVDVPAGLPGEAWDGPPVDVPAARPGEAWDAPPVDVAAGRPGAASDALSADGPAAHSGDLFGAGSPDTAPVRPDGSRGERSPEAAPPVRSTDPSPAGPPNIADASFAQPAAEESDDEPLPQVIRPGDDVRVARLTDEVLVVDGRPRYHLADCPRLLGRQTEALRAAEAVELGFTPCGVCRPVDRLIATATRR